MYNILIYEQKNGKSEIKNYLYEIQQKTDKDSRIKVNKIVAYIRKLQENGLEMGENYIKHIKNEIWELRPLRDRILFAYIENNTFILLSIFTKKTRKTPKCEIEKAERLLKDYKDRRDSNE